MRYAILLTVLLAGCKSQSQADTRKQVEECIESCEELGCDTMVNRKHPYLYESGCICYCSSPSSTTD